MAANVANFLQSLHDFIDASISSNREQIEVIIDDIRQVCQHEIKEEETEYVCSLVFAKDTGLISFLQKTQNSEEIQNGKSAALDIISGLIQKVGRNVLPYAVDIKEATLAVYSCDRFAKVKNAAIPVLIKLLELTAGSSLGEELKVDKMIQKFFNELTKASKLSATVKANIYYLLGVIAEVFPELMTPYSDRLVGLYTSSLRMEMTSKTKKPELAIISGCLEGLTAFMLNFTHSAEEGSKYSYEIFKYMRMAIDPNIEHTRYDMPKAGLKLLTRHAGQFQQYLMDDYQNLFDKLLKWSRHHNREILHAGAAALESFVKEICDALVQRAQEGQTEGSVFKFLLIQFRTIMNAKNSTDKHVSLAIKGYGQLAAPCRMFLSEADTQFMLNEMISKCEHQFFSQVEELDEKLISIPSYLTALSHIIRQVDSVSAPYAVVLERLIILLMENFHRVVKKLQFVTYKSILLLLLTLVDKAAVFQQILSTIVYQGLIRTCSHPPLAETSQSEDRLGDMDVPGANKTVTYKDFVPLWLGMLDSERIKDLAAEDFTLADRRELTKAVYSQLMAALMKILRKLDLEATVADSALEGDAEMEEREVLSADPTYGVIAKKPKDFYVFINLVDFCKDVLVTSHWNLFEDWVYTFAHTLVVMSTRHPLVSGFYRLLSVTMTLADKLSYFKAFDSQSQKSPRLEESMDIGEGGVATGAGQEVEVTFHLIKKFSKEVLVRMKQYRNELLASCLTLILSLPKEIIVDQMSSVVPAIQVTFTLGLSYLPLAEVGLQALESWFRQLPASVLEAHYTSILPYLDPYLRTDDLGAEDVVKETTVVVSAKKSSRRSKAPIRLIKNAQSADDKGSKSQLSQVKQRILYFLGSLGGQVNHTLQDRADADISNEAVAWDSQKHLRFDVPFFDMKPVIFFDPFLPHVVKLAQQSSDRQTKVAACELLHSLVLYALGRGAQLPGDRQNKYPMERLYRKLFPPLFALACDVEQVCKDLFEPLVMQLIHWFTSNKMSESPETMALLDCIYDGLVQPSDPSLRDFSARCLREFLKWSLKQISKKAAEKNPINAKSVLKRMFSFSLHPSAFKRLGAALAFNNIYMVFREENALVDRFTFQILVNFVESLAMAHTDEKSLGTQEQCSKALDHLERIIRVKVDMLKEDPGLKVRPEPSAWSSRKLEFAVRWLTRQCGRPQTECRHVCMRLVYNLCPLLQGVKSQKTFFSIIHKSEGASYFLKRFEGGGQAASDTHGILGQPTLPGKDKKSFSLSATTRWFDLVLAALDCSCWVFGEDLMTLSQLFTGKGSEMSCMFKSLEFFLRSVAFQDIEGVSKLFSSSKVTVFTPWEKDEFNRMKCTVIIRLWNFLSILLARHSQEVLKVVPASLWCEDLWRLLCDCVLRPASVGFNLADTEIMLNLPKEMSQVLAVVHKHLPAQLLKQFKVTLRRLLETECNLTSSLPLDLSSASLDYTQLSQMVGGYRQLHAAKLLMDQLPAAATAGTTSKADLASLLLDNVFEGLVQTEDRTRTAATLSPTAQTLANALLELSLQLSFDVDKLVAKILDKSSVQGARKNIEIGHGDFFLTTFSSTLASHIMTSSAREIVRSLMTHASKEPRCVSRVLLAVLDHALKDRSLRKKEGVAVCREMVSSWREVGSWWGADSSAETQGLALLVLTKVFLIDSQFIKELGPGVESVFEMFLSMLTDCHTTLAFKNQVLDLLPFFVTLKGEQSSKVIDGLNRFIADNFPLKGNEFSKGTHKYNDYISAIDKLLVAMEMTGSAQLLETVISVFCREPRHPHEDAIQAGIARFVQRLTPDGLATALNVPYAIFSKEQSYFHEIRWAAVERVCLPMLHLSPRVTVIEFFSSHIHELINNIDCKLNKSSESVFAHQLTTKSGSFQLLEVMYSSLSKDDVNSKTSAVNLRFCHGKVDTGKEMTQRITKAAQEAKGEDCRGESLLVELRRQYHCHAYNLLMAIISCVQTDIKFYKGFLFQDNVPKGQFLLDNIIDMDFAHSFDIELDSPLERRKKFVSIRSEAQEQKRGAGGGAGSSGNSSATPSLHLASQYLADSSLTDDLNQYDFNISSSAQGSFSGQDVKSGSSVPGSEESQLSEPGVSGDYMELEMDSLNQHECMAPLIALLRHMVATKISPEPTAGAPAKEMPAWMPYLHDKMSSPSSHVNTKLFIAKLVINCTKVFQPFAKFWLRPFCQLLFSPEVSGSGVTYFAVDLIVTMVSWHTVAIPEDSAEGRAMASRVVSFLIANVFHTNRQVFRNNLELLRTLLECWHDRVDIPYGTIYGLFKSTDPKSGRSSTGVQVLAVVLSADFPPYGPSAPVDKDKYLSSLSNLMNHHLKIVYAATAEVIGLVLLKMERSDGEVEGSFHDHLVSQLSNLSHAKTDNFIVCLHRIHKTFPKFTVRFLSKLLFLLPNLHGEFRPACLEVILGHVDQMEDAFLEINSKGLPSFLTHRDEDTQLVSLKIVKALALKMSPAELLSLLPSVKSFSSHSSSACRTVMLEVFMWAYDNYRAGEDEESHRVMSLTKEALLRGLCDENLACRLMCQNFWSSNTRLPESTLERTVSMLEAMYSPSTEPHYLAYATNLLLQATSKSPDYTRKVFEHALSECTFQDYSVQSSWRQRHAVMTPLFASTLVSQSMDTDESDQLDGGLRATQDVQQFTATMDATGAGRVFNWLTQSSLDTFTDTAVIGGDSQLLFRRDRGPQGGQGSAKGSSLKGRPSGEKKMAAVRTPAGGGAGPGDAAAVTGGNQDVADGGAGSQTDIWRLKRRFLKDKDAQSVHFMRRNIRLRQMREEAAREQRARRENHVTLYRKYRIGDLPDIQITYQYIIAPLQALAHRDSTVASLLFSSLFQAIFRAMDQVKTEREMEELTAQINRSMESLLAQSTHYFPPFMGSIFNILYEVRSSLKAPASEVGVSAIVSNQQTLGMVVLEEQLIQASSAQAGTTSKRARREAETLDADTVLWIELSRLYKSTGDFDVLQGIFSDKLGTKDVTRTAIEAESRGDYKAALRAYREAMTCESWEDGDPLEAEVDFWDDNRMECLNRLTQWQDLEEVSVRGVDSSDEPNLDKVWEDTFYQEHYLPYMVRSKLKLVLAGEGNQQPLLTFMDRALSDEGKKQYIQSRYCEELALLYLWQEDFDRARHFTSLAFQRFLQDWSSTTSLMVSGQTDILRRLQGLVELQEFLDLVGIDGGGGVSPSGVRVLVDKWQHRWPHSLLDPATIWDDVIVNRTVYLTQMSERLRKGQEEENSEEPTWREAAVAERLEEMKLWMLLKMAESCRVQNNVTLSLQLLRNIRTSCKRASNKQPLLEWVHLYAKTHHTKAGNTPTPWADDTFGNVLSTLDELDKMKGSPALYERPDMGLRHSTLGGRGVDLLLGGLLALQSTEGLSENTRTKLAAQANAGAGTYEQLVNGLISKGFHSLKAAVSEEGSRSGGAEVRQTAMTCEEANLELAKFCDKYLRLLEDDELPARCDTSQFPRTVVLCLLRAIKGGQLEARERFPRLLQLPELYPDVVDVFNKKVTEVPSWMFIMWVSQMTALLDKPEADIVEPVLTKIAAEYPQALVYAFRMSFEGFKFGSTPQEKKRLEKVEKLAELVNIPLVNLFISALEQFEEPDIVFKDWGKEMRKLLNAQKRDKGEIKKVYLELYQSLLEQPASGRQDSGGSQASVSSTVTSVPMGEVRRGFATSCKAEFDKAFGKNGDKLTSMNVKEFQSMVRKINEVINKHKNKRQPAAANLKDYCPWMAEFNPSHNGRELEIPGQYRGLDKPLPEYHVRVSGFDERVLVMKSLRKPKRITVRGNDERDYPYLVKSGEDLRQDDRIESLFYIMNKVMTSDPNCRQRKLHLKTYQVIPMTPKVGLIEWMSNTCPLKEFLQDAYTEEERKFLEGNQSPVIQHNQWMAKLVDKKDSGNWQMMYDRVYMKYSHTETVKEFRLKQGKIPWNLSRRALQQLSSGPEAFHVLRTSLVTSHATLCLCQYLLGIGDRHLSNFMVSLKTGHMIGIDFGHAFGTATQFLPVPELVPFRLTRQLVNLTMPLPVKGQMESSMCHVLRALRRDSDLLLSTMDVFVKEPSLDWLDLAERQMNEGKESEDAAEDDNWYPKQKIQFARRKLRGDHPCYIMKEELALGHSKRPAFKSLVNVLMGKDSVRAGLPAHGLSVEQQVAALIDQTTDPNILGRTWGGWEPWV
ncbi:DNA-dependent protein kinase catalytic subunit [Aplysia californica]|uniref:DNA-dependent protein kinase catalytic subunit n=1 Tax=Aplysia californica TaxID=6500 RepID=A0ABM1W0X3_APLCA|nr:DNA-dependent protein kinase catalytic subunit [Aplysia californica]